MKSESFKVVKEQRVIYYLIRNRPNLSLSLESDRRCRGDPDKA